MSFTDAIGSVGATSVPSPKAVTGTVPLDTRYSPSRLLAEALWITKGQKREEIAGNRLRHPKGK